ncbi:MAG: histidine phosphatase family protein [Moheibacter sp.]
MKHLILFRHAKSSWEQNVNDKQRDLLEIGVERTRKSAAQLKVDLPFEPQNWFSSPAVRARKTAEIAAEYFTSPSVQFDEDLYTFSFFDLLKTIKNFDNGFDSAIVFGHNEAFTEFVSRMGNQYINNLPTSGIAWIEFDTDQWSLIEKGNTRLIIRPKNL